MGRLGSSRRRVNPVSPPRENCHLENEMGSSPLVIEGPWEEIQARSAELAGHWVRVTVVYQTSTGDRERQPLDPRNQRMLELLAQWEQTPLTEDELGVLDE